MAHATVGDHEATYSASGWRPFRVTAMLVPFEPPLRETRPVTPEPFTAWKVLLAEPPPPAGLHSARSAAKKEQEARTRVDSRMRRIAISFRERAWHPLPSSASL